MNLRLVSLLVSSLVATTAQAADPTLVNITPGFSFAEYSGAAAVGNNNVNLNSKLFFIDEKVASGWKAWYVFFDPKNSQKIDATIHFDQPIHAVLGTRATLDASNASYGIDVDGDGLFNDYQTSRLIGVESGDKAIWSLGGHDLRISWTASNPGDHLRVLTAVPEPSTYALFAVGLLGLGVASYRRRHAK